MFNRQSSFVNDIIITQTEILFLIKPLHFPPVWNYDFHAAGFITKAEKNFSEGCLYRYINPFGQWKKKRVTKKKSRKGKKRFRGEKKKEKKYLWNMKARGEKDRKPCSRHDNKSNKMFIQTNKDFFFLLLKSEISPLGNASVADAEFCSIFFNINTRPDYLFTRVIYLFRGRGNEIAFSKR